MKALRVIKFVFIGLAFIAVFSLITMLLWNWLIPDIFKGPTISYIQAFGLLALIQILFVLGPGNRPHYRNRHYHWRKHMMERWKKMTPEEREQWKNKCGHWHWDEKSEPENTAKNDV